jgi:hypothetical protein
VVERSLRDRAQAARRRPVGLRDRVDIFSC